MSVHATNGTNVLQWSEFQDLLKYLEIPQVDAVYSFKLECGMREDKVTIHGEVVKTIEHQTFNGTWHSKEYKVLCEKLGVYKIDTTTSEVLTIEIDEAVTMEVCYMPFKNELTK